MIPRGEDGEVPGADCRELFDKPDVLRLLDRFDLLGVGMAGMFICHCSLAIQEETMVIWVTEKHY